MEKGKKRDEKGGRGGVLNSERNEGKERRRVIQGILRSGERER